MEVSQLRCFLAVAEELHFGRAAARLHLTPSPVSRAVKDLEREVGTALFVRQYHQVELTRAGGYLAERVTTLLAEIDRLAADTLANAAQHVEVRVGGAHLAPPAILDQVVVCAERALSDRRVEVVVGQSTELLDRLRRRTLDLAVVHVPVDDPDVDVLEMGSYDFSLAVLRGDELASRGQVSLTELADRTVVTVSEAVQPTVMSRLHASLATAGVIRVIRQPDADMYKLAEHVRRTGSVTLVRAGRGQGGPRVFGSDFAIVPLTDGPRFFVGVSWLRSRAEDDVVRAVVAAVRATVTEGPGGATDASAGVAAG